MLNAWTGLLQNLQSNQQKNNLSLKTEQPSLLSTVFGMVQVDQAHKRTWQTLGNINLIKKFLAQDVAAVQMQCYCVSYPIVQVLSVFQ